MLLLHHLVIEGAVAAINCPQGGLPKINIGLLPFSKQPPSTLLSRQKSLFGFFVSLVVKNLHDLRSKIQSWILPKKRTLCKLNLETEIEKKTTTTTVITLSHILTVYKMAS